MSVTFRLTGTEAWQRQMGDLARRFPSALLAALRKELEVDREAVVRRTPVDLGALRNSIHVFGLALTGRGVEAGIAAGGPSAPYALYVHENLTAKHTVGQAKYITSVMEASVPDYPERIAKRLRAEGRL